MPPLEDCSDAEPVNGDVIVTIRALNMQPKVGGDEEHENIFHTGRHIEDKVCNLIINMEVVLMTL